MDNICIDCRNSADCKHNPTANQWIVAGCPSFKKVSPYDYIVSPIIEWCEENYYTDFLVTIWVGDHEITEYLEFDFNTLDFIWQMDWWEGEKDVRLLGFTPLTDIHIHNYPTSTNADRIRSMSDEELAEYLIADIEAEAIRRAGRYLTSGEINRAIADCLSWLRSPAEEGEG